MSEIPTTVGSEARRSAILQEAEDRYGEGALFVYARRQQKDFAALTLEEAMQICGEYMVDEDADLLWGTLDKWHTAATVITEKSPGTIARARELGKNILRERGVMAGEDDGETSE